MLHSHHWWPETPPPSAHYHFCYEDFSQPPKNEAVTIGVSCPDCLRRMPIYNTDTEAAAAARMQVKECREACQCGNYALLDEVVAAHGFESTSWVMGGGIPVG